jgi:hypothetical protein
MELGRQITKIFVTAIPYFIEQFGEQFVWITKNLLHFGSSFNGLVQNPFLHW